MNIWYILQHGGILKTYEMTHSQFSEFSETKWKAIELGIYNIRKSGCSELDVSYSEGTVRLLLAAHKWIHKIIFY